MCLRTALYARSAIVDATSAPTDDTAKPGGEICDPRAAVPVVGHETGQSRFDFLGESSGALRAGAFAMLASGAGRPSRALGIHVDRPRFTNARQTRRSARVFPLAPSQAARPGNDPQHLYP